MKKLIAILLIPVFLLVTAGVAITSLYCKGKISKVGIHVKACCKDVNKGGCCNTEFKLVKVEDAFIKGAASFAFNKLIDLYFPVFHFLYLPEIVINTSHFTTYWDKAPPSKKAGLYILFRSLII